jgi:two-component system response regulator
MMNLKPVVLVAEDDPDDQALLREAFAQAKLGLDLRIVRDGAELLDYLRGQGAFAGQDCPRPSLVLLDLNMPGMDGREALQQIKSDPRLRTLPVVVLTTSSAAEDIAATYARGASAYIPKPNTYQGLVDIVRTVGAFWLKTNVLPAEEDR